MTTAHDLLTFLRGGASPPLPAAKVNYGLADGIDPPLLSVTDFRAVPTYDTAGIAVTTVTCTLHAFAKSLDAAETLMGYYLDRLDQVAPPQWRVLRGGFVDLREVAQEELYVFHATASVTLVIDG